MEATIWKVVGDSASERHLLIDLEQFTLDRKLPLALLSPDAAPLVSDPLPDTLLMNVPVVEEIASLPELNPPVVGSTFDASALPEKQREQFGVWQGSVPGTAI